MCEKDVVALGFDPKKKTITYYHEDGEFCTFKPRLTKHAPDARESGAKIVKSKSKRSAKSARG